MALAPVPPDQPPVQPNYDIVDSRIQKALEARGLVHGGGGGNMGGMENERIGKLEVDVGIIKGSLDWAKIVVGIISAVSLGGFGIVISMMLNLSTKVDSQNAAITNKIDAITTTITDEFRAQRADQAAQTSAVANAITAAKLQSILTAPPTPLPSTLPGTLKPSP